MPGRGRTYWQAALAILAAAALLVVFHASLTPGHWHKNPQGRGCDICRSSQLPSPEPLLRVEIQSPAGVERHKHSVQAPAVFEPVLASSFPRAPPA